MMMMMMVGKSGFGMDTVTVHESCAVHQAVEEGDTYFLPQ